MYESSSDDDDIDEYNTDEYDTPSNDDSEYESSHDDGYESCDADNGYKSSDNDDDNYNDESDVNVDSITSAIVAVTITTAYKFNQVAYVSSDESSKEKEYTGLLTNHQRKRKRMKKNIRLGSLGSDPGIEI